MFIFVDKLCIPVTFVSEDILAKTNLLLIITFKNRYRDDKMCPFIYLSHIMFALRLIINHVICYFIN